MGVCLLGEEKGLLPKAANHFRGQSPAKKQEATESKLMYQLQNVPFPEVMVNYGVTPRWGYEGLFRRVAVR